MLIIQHFVFQPDRHVLYTGLIVGANLTAADALSNASMKERTMTDIIYNQHPAMFRNRPILFLFLLIVILGSLFGLVVYGITLLVLPALIGVLCFAAWYLGTISNRLVIDDRRVHFRNGLLSKHTKEISIDKIRAIEVSQSLLNRMTDVGTISIYTTGDNPEIILGGLPAPYTIKSSITPEHDEAA